MNAPATDIKDLLVSELGYEFGVDIFVSSQPATPINCVTLFDTSSTPPDGTVDGNNVFMRETIMVWVRNSNYQAAYLQAQAIIGVLHNRARITLSETFYLYINLMNGPTSIAQVGDGGDGGDTLLSMNFELQRKSAIVAAQDFLTFVTLAQALVAGTNVTLTVDYDAETITITSTGGITSVDWGDIEGTITNQTDLVAYIASQVSAATGGGFIAPVYFRTDDSDIATYKRISYLKEATETELEITLNAAAGLVTARSYIYDDALGTEVLDAGVYISTFRAKVSSISGETKLGFQAFVRHTDNTETTLFTAMSDDINDTEFATLKKESSQVQFNVETTDRFGVRILAQTTKVTNVTITTVVGGTNASYFSTPIALRHDLLREKNENPLFLHVTQAEKDKIPTTTTAVVTIAVADWAGGTSCSKAVIGANTTSKKIFVTYDRTNEALAATYGLRGEDVIVNGQMPFTVSTLPTVPITLTLVMEN